MEAHNAHHHHHHLDMGGSSFGGSIMAATDFLMVDDLLDFSNEEIAGPIGDSCNNNETNTNTNTNAESSVLTDSTTIADTIHFDAGDYPPQDLCVPLDEVAELEWLSNFVEDSFSTESVSAAAAAAELSNTANNGGHESTATKKTLIINNNNNDNDYSAETAEENTAELHPVRGRARSKRSRAAVCNWVSYLLSPTSSATTKLSDSCGSSSASECSNQPNCGSSALVTASKPKKRTTAAAAAAATTAVEERKCSHCGTHKTPQWRAGPEGPKTLCNACGVRFKSGRLLPEYRPASSPSFVVSLHSNSHRKVLEMRRKKQQQQQVQSHKHHLQELVQGLIRGSSSSSSTGTVAPTSTHDASTSAHSIFMEKKFDDECLLHTANTSVVVEHSFCRV